MSFYTRSPNSKDQKHNSVSPSLHKSWAEQVHLHECETNNESREDSVSPVNDISPNHASNSSNVSQDRQIAVEFIDDVNEEKYKRLVQEEKIKTPFKRRHDLDSSESTPLKRRHELDSPVNSPNTSNSDGSSENYDFKAEKRLRHNSQNSTSSNYKYVEKDPAILARRQKQIDYGKNTVAYDRYLEAVPRSERSKDHPSTPNKYGKYSRRAFDGLIKIWRKQLHYYDPPKVEAEDDENDSSSEDSD